MSESMGDIKDKLLNTNLSEVSIYSIDRDLNIGDIVYGYLTNPFKAKKGVIEPQYPFKVIGRSFDKIYLLGQYPVLQCTFEEIFESHLDWFYVHFLRDGKDVRFESVRVPSVDDLALVDFENLDIRENTSFWTVSRDQHIAKASWAVRDGKMVHLVCNFKTSLVPFAEIPYPNPKDKDKIKKWINTNGRKTYRSKLDHGPCGSFKKACYLCGVGSACLAGHGDDDFSLAPMDDLILKLDHPESTGYRITESDRARIISVLKEYYNYDYKENNYEEKVHSKDS